jgi:hypothetical protein
MERFKTNSTEALAFLDSLETKVKLRLQQHGDEIAGSTHEVYGIIAEEFHELMLAMHNNESSDFYSELEDIAVACIFGLITIKRLKNVTH